MSVPPITNPYNPPAHTGVDYGAKCGRRLFAPISGVARWRKLSTSYGWHIIVTGPKGFLDCYLAHLSKIEVKQGSKVKRGDLLGRAGSTGKSTGCHLHYEERYKGAHRKPKFGSRCFR